MIPEETLELPDLPSIPVIRDTYCSQEMTDKIVSHLCNKKPELVAELVRVEKKKLIIDLRHKACEKIIAYLRKEGAAFVDVPPTRLGMLDFIYELCRRIRKALGREDMPLLGKPLAPGPEGPFPKLINKPVWVLANGKPRVDQNLADTVIQAAYQKRPDIFYEYAEQIRRLIRSYEISQALSGLIKDTLSGELKVFYPEIANEAHSRLNDMCEIVPRS